MKNKHINRMILGRGIFMDIVKKDNDNNLIMGEEPELIKSSITFQGKNNRLICEEGVSLKNSKIKFLGDNSIIFLGKSRGNLQLHVPIYNNSVLFIDKFTKTNGSLHLLLSEEKNIIIGKHCLFSFDIWFRLADPHLIYNSDNKKRINFSKSIYLGDHIWIGQDALILKGTKVGSGSIIGAKSVITNKEIKSNSIWAGNPGKEINTNIFWDIEHVHNYKQEDTEKSLYFDDDCWIYEKDSFTLNIEDIENNLQNMNLDEKVDYLIKLSNLDNKNRFYL